MRNERQGIRTFVYPPPLPVPPPPDIAPLVAEVTPLTATASEIQMVAARLGALGTPYPLASYMAETFLIGTAAPVTVATGLVARGVALLWPGRCRKPSSASRPLTSTST